MSDSEEHLVTVRPSGGRPWCTEQGHAPKHGPASFCAMTWELGITEEDNPDEWRELKRLMRRERNAR